MTDLHVIGRDRQDACLHELLDDLPFGCAEGRQRQAGTGDFGLRGPQELEEQRTHLPGRVVLERTDHPLGEGLDGGTQPAGGLVVGDRHPLTLTHAPGEEQGVRQQRQHAGRHLVDGRAGRQVADHQRGQARLDGDPGEGCGLLDGLHGARPGHGGEQDGTLEGVPQGGLGCQEPERVRPDPQDDDVVTGQGHQRRHRRREPFRGAEHILQLVDHDEVDVGRHRIGHVGGREDVTLPAREDTIGPALAARDPCRQQRRLATPGRAHHRDHAPPVAVEDHARDPCRFRVLPEEACRVRDRERAKADVGGSRIAQPGQGGTEIGPRGEALAQPERGHEPVEVASQCRGRHMPAAQPTLHRCRRNPGDLRCRADREVLAHPLRIHEPGDVLRRTGSIRHRIMIHHPRAARAPIPRGRTSAFRVRQTSTQP